MARVKVNLKPKSDKKPVQSVTLTLTLKEALALRDVTYDDSRTESYNVFIALDTALERAGYLQFD